MKDPTKENTIFSVDERQCALIVVDCQNDFMCPEGALFCPGADQKLREINGLITRGDFKVVIKSRDWHPVDHCSFRTGAQNGIWPVHCVQGSRGAEFHPGLASKEGEYIVSKGQLSDTESYSAFGLRNKEDSGLQKILDDNKIKQLIVCGLCLDYCVKDTCLDGRDRGYDVIFVEDASPGIASESSNTAMQLMSQRGVKRIMSTEFMRL